ncbi:hypothetical protein F4778DRAFT_463015 [Xylariomycetidae sp. FL2044]|nr:hypothetical protein F4778DRAFT_463015 [Xylariomycetidae sp. FL2044]
MDTAYKQHASQARRKNRSSTNLNHLSLAPLTSKLPLADHDDLPDFVSSPLQYNLSYLQGKSAPTTPRLLQSPSRTRTNSPARRASIPHVTDANLPKSKSTTQLALPRARHNGLGALSPASGHRRKDDHGSSGHKERSDSDWMLRAGALISSGTRESKGQAWLVTRDSSISLTGLRNADEEAHERELAREKELASRRSSRRGSIAAAVEDMLAPGSHYGSRMSSRIGSRLGSRSHSRVGSRSQLRTPSERHLQDGYFGQQQIGEEQIPGPDFVSLDEQLESVEVDTSEADEAAVRKLVNRRSGGVGAWMLSLFSVEEYDEDSDNADRDLTDGETEESHLPRSASTVDFEGISYVEEYDPPPESDEGSWKDAAWLLSIASKVLL